MHEHVRTRSWTERSVCGVITDVLFPSGILRYRVDFQSLDTDPDLDYYDDDDDDEYWRTERLHVYTLFKSYHISGVQIN